MADWENILYFKIAKVKSVNFLTSSLRSDVTSQNEMDGFIFLYFVFINNLICLLKKIKM